MSVFTGSVQSRFRGAGNYGLKLAVGGKQGALAKNDSIYGFNELHYIGAAYQRSGQTVYKAQAVIAVISVECQLYLGEIFIVQRGNIHCPDKG